MPRITEVKEGDRVTHKESANGFYDGVVTKVTDGESPVVHVALDSDSEFSEDNGEAVQLSMQEALTAANRCPEAYQGSRSGSHSKEIFGRQAEKGHLGQSRLVRLAASRSQLQHSCSRQ